MKKIFYTVSLAIILALVFIVSSPNKANATLSSLNCPGSPCAYPITPSQLPGYPFFTSQAQLSSNFTVYNYLMNADTNTTPDGVRRTPSFSSWVSPRDNTTVMQSVTVEAGTTSVALSFNTAAAVGWSSSGYALGYNSIIPNTPGFTDIPPGTKTGMYFANSAGSYASSKVNFSYSTDKPGGFTEGDYNIEIPYKAVNIFSNGRYACVANNAATTERTWTSDCPLSISTFLLKVYVKPKTQQNSVGALTCTTEGTGAGKNNYFTGYAVDSSNQASPPTIALLEDGKDPVYITANNNNSSTYNNLKSSLPGMLPTTNYDFKVNIGDYGYHDGQNHRVTAVLVTSMWPWFTLPANAFNANPFSFGFNVQPPLITNNCNNVDQWMYPWLQTKGGDVIANGQIIGQNIQNPPSVIYSGARIESAADKEAEYLVISAVGGGSPFCSTNRYIPTNAASQITGIPTSWYCNNGSGYKVLNNYDLNAGTTGDAIVAGANKAFSAINNPGTSECAATKNKSSLATISVPPACTPAISNGAVIYKLSKDPDNKYNLDNITVSKGRATIIVDGDLTINQNIVYSAATGITKPIDMPGLGIIVSGKIYISPLVNRIDALLYAADTIDTCHINGSQQPSQNCFNPLTVNGAMIGKRGFRFGRSFVNASNSPAELVQATPSLWLYPPLGMDLGSFSGSSNDYSIDYSEYQPRVSE